MRPQEETLVEHQLKMVVRIKLNHIYILNFIGRR